MTKKVRAMEVSDVSGSFAMIQLRLVSLLASPVKIKLIKAEILVQYSLKTQRNKKVSSSIA
jgi:hypothetical protein